MDCPTYEQLTRAAFEEPPGDAWRTHLTNCEACSRRAAILVGMREALAAGELDPVPDGILRAAEGIGHGEAPGQRERAAAPAVSGASGWRATLQVLVAELLPSPEPALLVRRAAVHEKRRLYRAGGYEIDLLVNAQRSLLGQVVPIDDDTDEVEDESAACTLVGSTVRTVPLTPTGEFHFTDVESETVSLTLEWNGVRVLFPEVDLSS